MYGWLKSTYLLLESEATILSTAISQGVYIILKLKESILTDISAHIAHHVFWCFVALNK